MGFVVGVSEKFIRVLLDGDAGFGYSVEGGDGEVRRELVLGEEAAEKGSLVGVEGGVIGFLCHGSKVFISFKVLNELKYIHKIYQ